MAVLFSVRQLAEIALTDGDYGLALRLVDLILRHFPGDVAAAHLLARLRLRQGSWDEARAGFERVLAADPENAAAHAGLALIAEMAGDLYGALEQLQRAFDLDSGNRELAEGIARFSARLPRSLPPDPASAIHATARRSLRRLEYRRAALQFQDALRRAPDRVEVAVGLAEALWLAGSPDEAERMAAHLLAAFPSLLKMTAILAGASFMRGEMEALFLLRRADELDPGSRIARRLFLDVGLPFPRVGTDHEIPDAELRHVLGVGPAAVAAGEWEEPEEEWEEDAEPFCLPEPELEGEWVRRRDP